MADQIQNVGDNQKWSGWYFARVVSSRSVVTMLLEWLLRESAIKQCLHFSLRGRVHINLTELENKTSNSSAQHCWTEGPGVNLWPLGSHLASAPSITPAAAAAGSLGSPKSSGFHFLPPPQGAGSAAQPVVLRKHLQHGAAGEPVAWELKVRLGHVWCRGGDAY